MYAYMYCILTRTHKDMLFYERECVTNLEIQIFQENWCFLGIRSM